MHFMLRSRPIAWLFALIFFPISVAASAEKPINLHGSISSDEGVRVAWQIEDWNGQTPETIIIRYNRGVVLASEGDIWIYSEPIPYPQGFVDLNDLNGLTTYVYQVGYLPKGEETMVWTNRNRFETKIEWGLLRFLLMAGALSLFVFGMKTMSEGVQASAGKRLRSVLNSMTKNRFAGVTSGFLLTGILQSSSATTVMTVSFVNAGLISLTQSAGIMMGANIGTTITGWLISVLGFRINISVYALLIVALALPLFLFRKAEVRSWGTALIGFALLFMGLGFLKETVPTFTEDSEVVMFFLRFSSIPVLGTLMFILLGAMVTVVVQSSSSAITLTMALCASGVIPFEVAAAMVLGENIGTTTTAEIAALVGNVHGKRSARIHTLFNVIGVTWMVFALPFVLKLIAGFLPSDPFGNTDSGRQAATTGLAAFHSVFNLINLLLLIWFVPSLVKLATWSVRSKGKDDETFRLEYIDTSIKISEISLIEVKRELGKFGDVATRMSGFVKSLLSETDSGEQEKLHHRIKKYEKITDRLELEIAEYCSQLSRKELSKAASDKIRCYLSIANDLERVGDIFYQMSNSLERKSASRIWFTPDQRSNLKMMFDQLDSALKCMLTNLNKDELTQTDVDRAKAIDKELDKMRNTLKKDYIEQIEEGQYNFRSGSIYSDLFTAIEKVGDHVLNVSEALNGEI